MAHCKISLTSCADPECFARGVPSFLVDEGGGRIKVPL